MAPLLLDDINNHPASYNRQIEWKQCCAKAMGYEWTLEDEEEAQHNNNATTTTQQLDVQITNLLSPEYYDDDFEEDESPQKESTTTITTTTIDDAWMKSAICIHNDIGRMANWIAQKRHQFISVDDMSDNEASIIQSTVTTFAATTGSEIESLRQMTLSQQQQQMSNNMTNHRSGIVQILFSRLKEEIVEPFSIVQKQRSRMAVRLWQDPLQCRLYVRRQIKSRKSVRSGIDHALGLTTDDDTVEEESHDQRFLPSSQDTVIKQSSFLDDYSLDDNLTKTNGQPIPRPQSFLFSKRKQSSDLSAQLKDKENVEDVPVSSFAPKVKVGTTVATKYASSSSADEERRRRTPKLAAVSYNQQQQQGSEMYASGIPTDEQQQEQLEQEAALLTISMSNDLDSVQKMEQRMVEITGLLSQFSEMVSEQREEVWNIHESTTTTKDNMEKGQDSLVDATERTKQSGHYMAKIILGMAAILLMFDILRS